jgi:post-segregation antitoxin (ccd killing protein)
MPESRTLPNALPRPDNPTRPAAESVNAQQPNGSARTAALDVLSTDVVASTAGVGPTSSEGERWLAENQKALVSSDEFVSMRGLPLARYRAF